MSAGGPTGPPDDSLRRLELARMRRIATGLLLAMAAVFIVARWVRPAWPSAADWLDAVAAFAEAAMIGALADWFAVTALFRRPFGLPIPHTDVIAANKDRIGRNLGHFLAHNFMTREVIAAEVARVDFAEAMARWLARPDNSHAMALGLLRALPGVRAAVGERLDLAASLPRWIGRLTERVHLARAAGRLVAVLVEQGRHHQVYAWLVLGAERFLLTHQAELRERFAASSPRWVPGMVDELIFDRVMLALQQQLADALQPGSAWLSRLEDWLALQIEHLASDARHEAALRAWLLQLLAHPQCGAALSAMTERAWESMAEAADDPARVRRVAGLLEAAAGALRHDVQLRLQLNHWLRSVAADALPAQGHLLAALIERVVARWDGPTVAAKLELQVGRDLQYIRINGTLVGGLVGLALHFIERLI